MADIPTLKELNDSTIADLESEFSTSIPAFGKSFLRGFAAVVAGLSRMLYLLIGNVQKNIFADTADSESIGGTLERFGRVKLGRNPFPATAGKYSVQITGSIGAVIPVNTTFKSDDNSLSPSFLFVLDSAVTMTSTTESILLRALTIGVESRLAIGNTLTLTAPIALVDNSATVLSEDEIPLASESLEDYRSKVLEAYRLEPQGGAGSDYRVWSLDVQAIDTVYPYATPAQVAEIDLYVEATIIDSTDGKGTPSATTLSDLEDAIELPTVDQPSRKPLGVFKVNYLPVAVKEIDIEITGFVGVTASLETLIFDTIKEYLSNVRPFVSSIDILENKNDIFATINIISLILQVSPGSSFGAVDLKVDSVSVPSYQFLYGEIPSLNTITYV